MKITLSRFRALSLMLVVLSLVQTMPSSASGGSSVGYGDNTNQLGTRSRLPNARSLNDEQKYLLGREIYGAKLGCEGCPLASEPLNAEVASRIMAEPDLMASLDKKERAMVEVYLKRRFKL